METKINLFKILKGKLTEFKKVILYPFAEMGVRPNVAHSPAGKLVLVRVLKGIGYGFGNQKRVLNQFVAERRRL